ncbi:hypothetical protein Acor_83690 [Acrocarpospora corrugata]|uniref:Uncharacterized protein n=1 Tax=Acrocarpospora corrugata TaxID=35763 RepID=A0A5M3WDG0_9ACTN|nr:hypothetical protein [Acrocarpospora corrugata]GES06300.1 hypothetical protein Acor_83690 [Acrocarpospora corrugata]
MQGHLALIARDRSLPALDRLQRFFTTLAGWKNLQRDLLKALLPVWYSDDNAIVRQKMRPALADRILPLLSDIVGDGVGENLGLPARSLVLADPDMIATWFGP